MRLMIRGGSLPVRGSKGMEWKYGDDLCVCGTKETEIHVIFSCKFYGLVYGQSSNLIRLDKDASEGHLCQIVNNFVKHNLKKQTMKYLGEVWTER